MKGEDAQRDPPRSGKILRALVIAAALGLLTAAIQLSAAPQNESFVAIESGPRYVRVGAIAAAETHRPVQAYGVVQAADRVVLSFTQPGRLIEREVKVGDRVTAGQRLARLDAQAYATASQAAAASVREADTTLEQLNRDADRVATLRLGGAASDADLERTRSATARVEASSDAARAQLREARRRLRETFLDAPFDGVVTYVGAEVGEVVAAGMPLITITGTGAREVEILVPETVASVLEIGTEVDVELPLLNRRDLHGRIVAMAHAGSRLGGLFPATVQLDDAEDVLPGAASTLRFEVPTNAQGFSVPVASVTSPSGSQPSIFVVRDGIARNVAVSLGELLGDRIAVEGTLRAGESVIVAGHVGLRDGEKVVVREGDGR